MTRLPRPVSAVLFDWDGTLADTVPLVTMATNETLLHHGFPEVTTADIHDGMRFPTAERMLYHVRHAGRRQVAELGRNLADEFYERADRLGHRYVDLFPGVRELLEAVAAINLPMGLVTNNRGSVVRSLLEHASLHELFPVVIAEEDVSNPKPDPEGLERALSILGVAADSALFVGDSLTDAGAAQAAQVLPVGVGWPEASIVHKPDSPYKYVFHSPNALLDAIQAARRP
jgi:HAD superfamily hydrolase (TIGR01509 family)